MKNFNTFYLLIVSLFVALSCSNSSESDVETLKLKETALRKEYDNIGAQISQIQEEVQKIEGGSKLALVTIDSVSQRTFRHFIDIQGKIESDQNISLYPEASAKVLEVYVEDGQKVSKGDKLAKLDSRILQENLAELESSLELATTMFERQEKLWKQNIGSEAQYLESRNNKVSLEKKISALREQMALYTLKAPFSGTIDRVFIKQGELALPQSAAIRLVNLDNMYAEAEVSENFLNDIKVGSPIYIFVTQSKDTISSKVTSVAKYINPSNRTFRIKAKLDNLGKGLAPNQLLNLKVQDIEIPDATVVKSNLIQQNPSGENFIYILDEKNIVRFVSLEIISEYGGYSFIKAPQIKKGTLIIDKGSRSVKNGQQVQVQR